MKKNRGNKKKRKMKKKMKSLQKCASRKPIAPPTIILPDLKKYSRKKNKKILKEYLKEE